MTVNAGIFDRTNLNTEVANLAAGLTADPDKLEAVLIQLADQSDANWSDYATNRITLGSVDGGNFTDTFVGVAYDIDGGAF